MKINRVITGIELNIDELTYMLTAANIAGYMEANEKICINDDQELTDTIIRMYSAWSNNSDGEGWGYRVEMELLKRFGVQKGSV